jgi:gas vesicle protein
MDTGKVIVSIIAGVAAGALIGVLVAPDKGVDTRRKIIQKGDDFARNFKTRFSEYLNNRKYDREKEYWEEPTTTSPVI